MLESGIGKGQFYKKKVLNHKYRVYFLRLYHIYFHNMERHNNLFEAKLTKHREKIWAVHRNLNDFKHIHIIGMHRKLILEISFYVSQDSSLWNFKK